jgi:hypothetical protein
VFGRASRTTARGELTKPLAPEFGSWQTRWLRLDGVAGGRVFVKPHYALPAELHAADEFTRRRPAMPPTPARNGEAAGRRRWTAGRRTVSSL